MLVSGLVEQRARIERNLVLRTEVGAQRANVLGFLESHGVDKVVGTVIFGIGEVWRKLTAATIPKAAAASMAGEAR